MKKKSLVLLSAGLDSTVNLFLAHELTDVQLTLTFDYGQVAAQKEILQARQISDLLNIPNQVIELPWLSKISESSLNSSSLKIPKNNEVSIDDLQISQKSAKSVWVPNRNGLFLNIAGCFADAKKIDYIVPGFNKEEAITFPDNSTDFMDALTSSFSYSTSNKAQVKCFTNHLNKTEIIKLSIDKKIPLDLIWPCYLNQDEWCGQCESCQRAKRAMLANGIEISKYF